MPTSFSYWEKTSFTSFDVIIVGAGIVGLNAAISLKKQQPNLNICVLDGGYLPTGASTKNAGFACFGSISELIEQEQVCGSEALAKLINRRWKGLQYLRNLLGDETIDFNNFGGYEIFNKNDTILAQKSVSKIEHFNQLTKQIVGKNAFSINNSKIKSFGLKNVDTLIYNQYEGQIDTGKMMLALIKYAQSTGMLILNNCKVNSYSSNAKAITLSTNRGDYLCNKLILATNAFIKTLIPEVEVMPGRGQVLITKPIKNLKIKGTFHYDKGYYYFRNINNRILLGGGRNLDFETEATTELKETPIIKEALVNLLKETILPNTQFEVDYFWSGIMAFGSPLEPLIAQAENNVFYATRCNGMGIAIGAQTGVDLANLALRNL
jgi:glycine/D-amino acid oxidase-like deaminating enzyme